MDICGRDDLFFALQLILGGNMDIRGRDDLFLYFALYKILGLKLDICVFFFAFHLMHNCIYVCLMTRNIGSG